MKILAVAVSAAILSGCATTAPQERVARVPPSNLLERCPSLPKATSGRLPDLVRNHAQVVEAATLCAEGKNGLIEWEIERLKDEGVEVGK